MQRVEKSDSRLNGIETIMRPGTTFSRFLAPETCSQNWGIRYHGCFKRDLLRAQRRRWSKPQAENRPCRATVLEVENDQQASCNCNHVLRYRHGEVWDMRPKDQSVAGFVTRECP